MGIPKTSKRRGVRVVKTIEHPQTKETLKFFADTENERFSSADATEVVAWCHEALRARAALTWIPVLQVKLSAEAWSRSAFSMRSYGTRERGRWHGNPGLDEAAFREYDPRKYDVAAVDCNVAFRRFYIASAAKGFRLIGWAEYKKCSDATELLDKSEVAQSLPYGFDGTIPYVDDGTESGPMGGGRGNPAVDDPAQRRVNTIIAYDESVFLTLDQIAQTLDNARRVVRGLIGEPESLKSFAAEKFLALPK